MDLNRTIDIIIRDLNEAREIIDDLKKYAGVPDWQVEMAKSKCKSASEVIALFKNLQLKTNPLTLEKPSVMEQTVPEKSPEKLEPVVLSPVEVSQKEDKKTEETHIPEPSPVVKEEIVHSARKAADSAIIADQFSNRPESYNEKLGSLKHEDDVLEVLHTKPLQSFNDAIGINDKFLFIREVFSGDVELYNQAIIKLESVRSLADARAVVISYTGDNTENEALRQLLDLIKRMFPSNE